MSVNVNHLSRNSSIVEPLSLPVPVPGLRCTLLRITHALRLPGCTPRNLPSDLNSRAVFLVASAGAAAAHAGEATQQVRADRMDVARGRHASQHRELPRVRRRSPQDHRQGFGAHAGARRGRRLQPGESILET